MRYAESDDGASDCTTAPETHDTEVPYHDDTISECLSDTSAGVESLIIFDWDDTLFPTSWMQDHALLQACEADRPFSKEQVSQLGMMAARARLTLEKAMKIGKVVIVTNAEEGWVEHSCNVFLPSLASLLESIDIVSARSNYGKYWDNPTEWKRLAFAFEVDRHYGSKCNGHRRNILSLGDSLHELNALMFVTKGIPNSCGKSVKFMEWPCISQLIEQHEILAETFQDIFDYNGDVDVEIGTAN